MAYDIPTVEPTAIRAGTSLIFTRDYPDYDPTTWTLTYHLVSPTEAPITITATEVDAEFKVSEAYTTTATWPAGEYLMSGFVSDGTENHQVYQGRITIYDAITGAESLEFKSRAEQIVEKLEAAILTSAGSQVISYSLLGRSYTYSTKTEALLDLKFWKGVVAAEKNIGKQRKVLGRFVSAR